MSNDIVDRLIEGCADKIDEDLLVDVLAEIMDIRWLLEQYADISNTLVDYTGHRPDCGAVSDGSDDDCTCGLDATVDDWENTSLEREGGPYITRLDRWRMIADQLAEALGHSPQARSSAEGIAAIDAYREASRD